MSQRYSKSIIASYATFKELYKSKNYNSPYQILAEFIKYIIVLKSLYSFTATEIQSYLISEFGFNPPIAVICTAMNSISEVERDHHTFKVKKIKGNELFPALRNQAEENSNEITNKLIEYVKKRVGTSVNPNIITQELISFVLDEEGIPEYQQAISSFVLDNENDKKITATISAIREGSILYSGLAFNISEYGSLSQPLTLFLDTEILFDIIGLNGVLFKSLSDDFINLIKYANKSGRIISLKYFAKVKEDIEQFYSKAERIISGYGDVNFSPAMEEIVRGCKDVSDVSDKKVEMYQKLKSEFCIIEDDKTSYYSESDTAYNLEGLQLSEYPTTDDINSEGYLFCSHINKLRKGKKYNDYFASKYLCVTDTRRVLEISKAITEHRKNSIKPEKLCDFAVSLSYITNLLWYKMNRGFGSVDFPKNIDVVIKARTILSGYISQEISLTYKDIRMKVAAGELTQEQAAARIVALKEKKTLPEDLNADNIEEALNFTEKHFASFEETLAQNRRLLMERDKTIKELSCSVEELKDQLSVASSQNIEKQQQIELLSQRVNAIEAHEKKRAQKKQNRRLLFRFVFSITWRIAAAICGISLIWLLCRVFGVDFPSWLSVVFGAIGLIVIAIPILQKDFKRYKEGKKDSCE